MGNFFAGGPRDGQWVQVTIDGKTLRGSIPAGQTRGVHLMAAYVPGEGVVIAQVEVGGKENEIKAAPRLLEAIDLRGKVVSADAMLAQRQLSVQIVEAGGECVWTVKDNQPQLLDDLATLFEGAPSDPSVGPATGPAIREATTIGKGHGRLEHRTLRASPGLKDYLDWPYAQQVFQLERRAERIKDGKITCETVYGMTSLGPDQAGPQRLLEVVRTHWNIENGLHYRRDETMREDWCHLRLGHAQHIWRPSTTWSWGCCCGAESATCPSNAAGMLPDGTRPSNSLHPCDSDFAQALRHRVGRLHLDSGELG